MNFLSLETTGLNPKKDQIYLVNLLLEDDYQGILVEDPADLQVLEKFDQVFYTYRGSLFEERFFQELDLALDLVDFYPSFRSYYQTQGWSLSLDALAERFHLEKPPSRKEAYRLYQEDASPDHRAALLAAGEVNIRLRQGIYQAFEAMKKADSISLTLDRSYQAWLMTYELIQDMLILHYETDRDLAATSYQGDYFLMEDEAGGFRLEFLLDKGSFQGQKARAVFWDQLFLIKTDVFYPDNIRALGLKALKSLA